MLTRRPAFRRDDGAWTLIAFFLAVAFLAAQAATLDYGTRINDLPHIAGYKIEGDVLRGSGLERQQVVGAGVTHAETLDTWMLRYKLYSTDADEMVNIIALARIRPHDRQFDPGFYQYGGAFLYPLGLWYFTWNKLGVLKLGTLEQLLDDPQRMDRVWILGRAFVLIAFALSGAILFAALRHVASARTATFCLGIYLFCPASVMFSLLMKPHWYALLWVNLALLGLVRVVARRARLGFGGELLVGICTGMAVGSATTFAIFSVLVWCAIVLLVRQGRASFWALFRIPMAAVAIFAATNPYYFLNWETMRAESAATAAGWFTAPTFNPAVLLLYIDNSLFIGFGVAATIVLLGAVAYRLMRGDPPAARFAALAILVPLVIVAFVTESMAKWHINFRYAAYVLPLALAFLATFDFAGRTALLATTLLLTVAQAAPLKLAHIDENDPVHSTRLASASWIDANIPTGSSICPGTRTLTPYDSPPFDLARYKINEPDCTWMIRVERETDSLQPDPGLEMVMRFRPRLSPEEFPLVFSHVNPQITIYRRPAGSG